MSAIIDLSDLISLMTGGQIASLNAMILNRTGGGAVVPESKYQHKDWQVAGAAQTAAVVGALHSSWTLDGVPGPGTVPTTWVNPTRATPGALLQIDPTGGRKKFISNCTAFSAAAGTLLIYDRLGHMGGLSGTSTAAQNVNGGVPAAITRYASGKGNRIFLEVYTSVGNTIATASVAYVDENGAGATAVGSIGQSTGALGRRLAQSSIPCKNPNGNPGVRSVTSITLSVSTGTTGNFGLVVAHELLAIEVGAAGMPDVGAFLDANLEILPNACLGWVFAPTTAATLTGPIVMGTLDFVDK